MALHSKATQNDRRLKRINTDARHKINQETKKAEEELDKTETQMRL
jgi:hypothetical protein